MMSHSANVESVENGYIVHIYDNRSDTERSKTFIASNQHEVGEIIKKHLKGDDENVKANRKRPDRRQQEKGV